ncbi:Partner of Y14 and mago [Populus alba x Populus x berolinensis]|nr:Partner of Y14 and mago [Populus alba x Populus x berolinensis]
MTEISKTLKEGERIVAPSRRPDGTLRKPIRIRAGYVPQDEVAISTHPEWRKEMPIQGSASLVMIPDSHTQTKKLRAVKRNERKKEKRPQQACHLKREKKKHRSNRRWKHGKGGASG